MTQARITAAHVAVNGLDAQIKIANALYAFVDLNKIDISKLGLVVEAPSGIELDENGCFDLTIRLQVH
jgi:hypothetical protein